MRALLVNLAAVPQLAETLHAVRSLPPPRYNDAAWAIVEALLDVLHRAAAYLLLRFRDTGTIDFTQGTIGALAALGDDAPSELLLRLDFRVQHLLIDEFQDTSFTQFELIERLIAGWQPDDGRTLLVVGDPMQSIYRFRGAEVRLFVEAQQAERVAGLPIENLVLRRNFRSQPALVEWANRVFADALGPRSDPWRGKVGFTSAVPAVDALPDAAATIDIAADPDAEARVVVGRVRAAIAEGAERIAVLVRARSHLDPLLGILRDKGIAFAAVELDALAERQSILDLVSLTHALLQPADRLSWLAVLRAPWCGMQLADLFVIAHAASTRAAGSIAGLIADSAPVAGLSDDGRARFTRIGEVLARSLASRGRAGVAARVRGAWVALGGPATLREASDVDAAEQFFALLSQHEFAGDIPAWASFVDALWTLYAAPEVAERVRVQVMTLHRAKGLEFDTVILPGLAQPTKREDTEILRWRRRPQGLLLASTKEKGGDDDPVYAYLGLLGADEQSAELGRMLYVGCTRAKRRLHLTAVLEPRAKNGVVEWGSPPSGSALARCWSGLCTEIGGPPAPVPAWQQPVAARPLRRLPVDWQPPQPLPAVPLVTAPEKAIATIPFDWARETARHVGTVAHRVFAEIVRDGLAAWSPARAAALDPRIRAELTSTGVDESELDGAAANVLQAVRALLTDERGRWLVDSAHADARSEWALAGIDGGEVAHIVIDRSFVTEGARWIVDFKTGAHEGAAVDAFIDREVARYRSQLERYARFVRALDARPIRLGLYFPLQRAWREWPYDG
jgi:ATP-dependent exoDNAse (exonuclease V) beta subunit